MEPFFIGQQSIRKFLAVEMAHARKSGKPMSHILLTGPAGMGKSTLAKLIATALGAEIKSYVADSTWNATKVFKELMSLDITGYTSGGRMTPTALRYVVFMDEVHLLPTCEPWYSVLQENEITHGGKVNWLPEITFIGATTNPSLPKPFLDRIHLTFRFEPYTVGELTELIQHHAHIPDADARNIAERSRQTARIALNYAERYIAHGGLAFFDKWGIDSMGLTPLDRAYITALKAANRPLSLKSLASVTMEDQRSLESIVEPYLKSLGIIIVTPQGRMLAEVDSVNRNGRSREPVEQETGTATLDSFMERVFNFA